MTHTASTFAVADAAGLEATLDRLAGRVAAEFADVTGLVGIERRGVPVAERLADRLRGRLGRDLPVGRVTLKRYGDDLELLHRQPRFEEHPLPFDPEGAEVLLVDDVLYSGRTLLTACRHLVGLGAEVVRTAVVAERDGREVPIAADFVGLCLEVGHGRVIDLHVPPFEDDLALMLKNPRDQNEEET